MKRLEELQGLGEGLGPEIGPHLAKADVAPALGLFGGIGLAQVFFLLKKLMTFKGHLFCWFIRYFDIMIFG